MTKKLLVISLSAGSGHVRAAESILKTANQQFPELEIEHIDMAKYVSLPMKKTAIDSYALMVKRLPELWGFLYDKIDNPKVTGRFNKLTKQLKGMNSLRLYNFIFSYRPDIILCTHFLPADVILNAPRRYKINLPITIVITDYDLHNLWLVPGTKHYFVATDKMKQIMIQKGLSEQQVTISGIPIDPVFYQHKSVIKLKEKYHLPKNEKLILVLSGGQGLGKSNHTVKILFKIKEPTVVIAIAGKNKKLENKLKNLKAPSDITLRSVGWTDSIDEYMRMADIIITKPGGITTTECLTLGKCIIAYQPIPGQEECNARYILENQFGKVADHSEELLYYINNYLTGKETVHKQNKPQNGDQIILDNITRMD